MTTDWKALCAELTECVSLMDDPPHELVARAQAALAKADSAVELNDDEITAWLDECANQFHAGDYSLYWVFDTPYDDLIDVVRAALKRWGGASDGWTYCIPEPNTTRPTDEEVGDWADHNGFINGIDGDPRGLWVSADHIGSIIRGALQRWGHTTTTDTP
jgi:hypothetical protein